MPGFAHETHESTLNSCHALVLSRVFSGL